MFNWIKKLFGEGYIYADITLADGESGSIKVKFIGDPQTLSIYELVEAEVWHQHRRKVTKVTNIKIIES